MLYYHFRNYSCRLNTNYYYENLRVAVLENEYLRISILIDKGTDIFEFLYKPKDIDFMWLSPWGIKNPSKYIPTIPSKDGNFMDFYEGGWQEILSNFGPAASYRDIQIGQHGEICLIPWQFEILEDSPSKISIKFNVRTYRTPFYIEKTLTLLADDPKLYIHEKLKNEGYVDMNVMWTHHPTFGGIFLDDSTVIDIAENKVKYVYKPKDKEIDIIDKNAKWPIINGYDGKNVDFSKSPSSTGNDQSIDELFLEDLKEGWYAVTNTGKKVGFGLRWEKEIFPYLLIWRMYGKSSKMAPWWGRVSCMALEPCSSFSLTGLADAIKNKSAMKMEPQQEISTSLIASCYERDSRVKRIDSEGIVI